MNFLYTFNVIVCAFFSLYPFPLWLFCIFLFSAFLLALLYMYIRTMFLFGKQKTVTFFMWLMMGKIQTWRCWHLWQCDWYSYNILWSRTSSLSWQKCAHPQPHSQMTCCVLSILQIYILQCACVCVCECVSCVFDAYGVANKWSMLQFLCEISISKSIDAWKIAAVAVAELCKNGMSN